MRAKALCSAGVHQQGLRAALHQVGVDGGLQAFRGFWHIVLLQQAVCTRWRNLFELLPGQRDNTVEQRQYLQLTDVLHIVARRLRKR